MEFGLGFLWLDLSRKSEPLRSRLHEPREVSNILVSFLGGGLTRIARLDSFSSALFDVSYILTQD